MLKTLLALGLILPVHASGASPLPTVVILSTGGTIASRYDPAKGGLVPALSGSDLVEAVPELAEVAHVQVDQISSIGSADMTPALWLKIAGRANEVLSNDDVAGVVVTHGTDTLEETSRGRGAGARSLGDGPRGLPSRRRSSARGVWRPGNPCAVYGHERACGRGRPGNRCGAYGLRWEMGIRPGVTPLLAYRSGDLQVPATGS